jgi:hypothetical protein
MNGNGMAFDKAIAKAVVVQDSLDVGGDLNASVAFLLMLQEEILSPDADLESSDIEAVLYDNRLGDGLVDSHAIAVHTAVDLSH